MGGENKCECYSCEREAYFKLQKHTGEKKYTKFCSKICRDGLCHHRMWEKCNNGEISAMQYGASMGDYRRGSICECSKCCVLAFFDDRLQTTQRFCSIACRDSKCQHK